MTEEIKEILDTIRVLVEQSPNKGSYGISHKKWKLLLDYITNLQDKLYSTNQVVKELLDIQEENEKNKKYSDFYKDMTDKWKDMSDVLKKICEDYKSRIEKAIEYINTHYLNANEPELLNILQGDDKSE